MEGWKMDIITYEIIDSEGRLQRKRIEPKTEVDKKNKKSTKPTELLEPPDIEKPDNPMGLEFPPGHISCPYCKHIVAPADRSSIFSALFLLFMGIIPGVIYILWGLTAPKCCPNCKCPITWHSICADFFTKNHCTPGVYCLYLFIQHTKRGQNAWNEADKNHGRRTLVIVAWVHRQKQQ